MHTNNRVWSGVRTSMQPAYITGHSETWDGKGLIAGHNTYYTYTAGGLSKMWIMKMHGKE